MLSHLLPPQRTIFIHELRCYFLPSKAAGLLIECGYHNIAALWRSVVKRELLVVMAVSMVLAFASRPAFAHHSGAMYDNDHPVTLTGTVTQYQLINPHTVIRFDVTDSQGKVENWEGITGTPQKLYRAGWRTDTLKPGDQVTITGAPYRDGRKVMGVKKVIGPDGKVWGGEGE